MLTHGFKYNQVVQTSFMVILHHYFHIFEHTYGYLMLLINTGKKQQHECFSKRLHV